MTATLFATAVLGVNSSKALWYATRSTGAVALLLLTAVVVLGVLGPLRLASERWPRFAVATLHRDLSLLGIVFIAVHVATTVLDGFAPIGWLAAVVPFQSSYRTLWLSLGTVAFDLLLAIVITSLMRSRLGHRRWRRIHWLAYASWPIAAFHGLGTGSDAAQPWLLGVTAACGAAVLLAVLVRLREPSGAGSAAGVRFRGWVGVAVAMPVLLLVFAVAGPLSPNWARRAGTPPRLLGANAQASTGATAGAAHVTNGPAAGAPAATATAPTPSRPFSARLVGSIRQTPVRNGAVLDLLLSLKGGPGHSSGGTLRIRLAGHPLPGGGVALVGSQVDLIPSASASDMSGSLTSLDGTHLSAQVLSSSGTRLNLDANLHVDQRTGSVTGRLSATPPSA